MSLDLATAAREIAAGNEAYLAGDYGLAIVRYEAALDAGAEGADLWFNLGNAFYRAGEHGRAALAFERSLRREPGDEGARANLELVRSQVTQEVSPREPLLARVGARVEPDAAAALLVVAWSLACGAWLLRRALRPPAARIAAGAAALVFLVGALAAGGAAWATWKVRHEGWAVVLEEAQVRTAPEPGAPAILAAGEGLKLRTDRRIGGYAHVRVGDRAGWIEAARIEAIDR